MLGYFRQFVAIVLFDFSVHFFGIFRRRADQLVNTLGFILLCLVLPVAWGLLVHVLFGMLRRPVAKSSDEASVADYQI